MNDQEKREILTKAKTIAVIGLSANGEKDSNKVARYLMSKGYLVVPVNPGASEILGQKCYPSLAAVDVPVDLVDVFRRPEDALKVAEECLAAGKKTLWYQLGAITPVDAAKVGAMGIEIISDCCVKQEHERLFNI